MNKERTEFLHVNQFLKLLTDETIIPIPQFPPEPDFIVELHNKVIGLEHTQLIRTKDNNAVDIKAHSKHADEILKKAEELFNLNNSACLMVHVSFKCSYGLAIPPVQLYKTDVVDLSKFIANFVTLNLPVILSSGHFSHFQFEAFDWDTGTYIFPEKIDHISITNTCNFKQPCWSANQGGIIPEIYNSKEFEAIWEKKNVKPANYKKTYSEIWLLIVEDSMDLTSYFDFYQESPTEVKTPYNRAFILRRAENRFIELITS